MSDRRVPVRLVFNADGFSGRLRQAVDAAGSLNARLALASATWEPHDWSTFKDES